jgi:predicted DNA-binding transcriptional regulator AlpA
MNLLSKKEMAESINISEKTLDRMRKEGLPWYDLGKILFDKDEVIEWIKNNRKRSSKK